jgi:hypothetical protein
MRFSKMVALEEEPAGGGEKRDLEERSWAAKEVGSPLRESVLAGFS